MVFPATNNNNNKNDATASGCPYAVALHPDEQDEEEHPRPTTPDAEQLLRSCPAFEKGSCPFKDAKSADELRLTLTQMPESHFAKDGKFFQVIQGLHQVNHKNAPVSPVFQLPGGCPVKLTQDDSGDKNDNTTMHNLTFTEALEKMSLAAVMAQEMKKLEGFHDDTDEEDEEEESSTIATRTETTTSSETPETKSTLSSSPQRKEHRTSLSESLKTGTAVSHQAAEDVHFVKNFIQGKIDRNLYRELVAMLYHVYAALEEQLDQHATKHFGSCHFPDELRRTPALQDDLEFWHGNSSKTLPPPLSDATRDYVQRLQYIGRTDPLLLLAHSYTRYLGDLSGGRILARVARRALHLDKQPGSGLDFYEFEHIASPKRFKDQYRQALDALPLTAEQIHKLVGEANVAFCLNMRLFEELDVQARLPGAVVRPLREALAFADMPTKSSNDDGHNNNNNSSGGGGKAEECPFLVKKAAAAAQNTPTATAAENNKGRCPWPFVFAHDPVQGMQDWQTWVVLGLFLCWTWQLLQKHW